MGILWRWRLSGLLVGMIVVLPAPASAQLNLGSTGTGVCVGVAPGGGTDCRAVDLTLNISGALDLSTVDFQIPGAMYGPGKWFYEDQFGGAMGQINPVDYSPAVLPDDYLFGYFDDTGRLALGPLFTPVPLAVGTPLTVRLFFTSWMTEPAVGDFTYDGGGTNAAGTPVTFSGGIVVSAAPEPGTVALLGTGLAIAGMGGAVRRRRVDSRRS